MSASLRGEMIAPRWCALLAATFGPWLSGCGAKGDHVACYPVSGQVLVGDKPADGVMVKFYNAKNPKNVDAPQPYATTDADGKFSLSTFDPGDGAPADDYIVILLWPVGPPGPSFPKDRLGNAYTNPDTTPFKATIAKGETRLEPFRIDPAKLVKNGSKPATPPADPLAPPD